MLGSGIYPVHGLHEFQPIAERIGGVESLETIELRVAAQPELEEKAKPSRSPSLIWNVKARMSSFR